MVLRCWILVLVGALAVAAAAAAANTDWTMTRYDEGQTGYTPQQLEMPLTLSWQYNTSKFPDNPSTPAVAGGFAYFSSGNRLYAVETAAGTQVWRYPSSDTLKCTIKTGITVWEDLVFFGGSNGILYAIDAKTGRTAWTYPTNAAIRSTPIVSGGIVYAGSDDNHLYAIDARSGESTWAGRFRTGDDVQATPAVAAGVVVFDSMDTNVYAANSATGKLRWMFRLPLSPVHGAPVVSGNLVYAGAGSVIHTLSSKTGQLRYTLNLPSDMVAPPAVAGNDLYVLCRNRKLYAYTVGLSVPKPKWSAPVVVGLVPVIPPTVAGNLVFVGTNRGMISAYSAEDGHLVWRYTLAPSTTGSSQKTEFTDISAPIVAADGALFVLADDGALRCFRPKAGDGTPPKIFNVIPESGTVMSGFPPISISAILYDESTGVDPNSIQLWIDDEQVDPTFDPTTLTLSYDTPVTRPIRKLPDGRRNLTIAAKDWKGNQLTYAWSFIADNSLSPKVIPRAIRQRIRGQPSGERTGGPPGGGPSGRPTVERGAVPPPPDSGEERERRGRGERGRRGSDGAVPPPPIVVPDPAPHPANE